MKNDHTGKMDFVADEIEYLDDSATAEYESDPKMQELIEHADQILTGQIDPMMREAMRDKPKELAEWDGIMREYAVIAAEDEAKKAQQKKAEAAKEAEGLKLAADMRAVMNRMNADLDRLMAHDGLDVETDALLERTFASIHEMDIEITLRCRDFPDQLESWKTLMQSYSELEAIFQSAREAEESEPAN